MTLLLDGMIALWVIAGLSSVVIALAQGRRAWLWLLLALLGGPVAPAALLVKGSPHGAKPDARLCAECFDRVTGDDMLCPRCRTQQKRPKAASHCCH